MLAGGEQWMLLPDFMFYTVLSVIMSVFVYAMSSDLLDLTLEIDLKT